MKKLPVFLLFLCCGLIFLSGGGAYALATSGDFLSSRTNLGLKGGSLYPPRDNYATGLIVGLSGDFFFNPVLSLELSLYRLSTDISPLAYEDSTEEKDLDPGTLSGYPLQISLKYQVPGGSRFSPYLLAGGSLVMYVHKVDLTQWEKVGFTGENKMKLGFGVQGGAGLNIFLSPDIALNIEARYAYTITGFSWTFSDQNHPEVTTTGDVNNLSVHYLMATGGIKIYL